MEIDKIILALMSEKIDDKKINKLKELGFNVIYLTTTPDRILSIDFDKMIIVVGR